MIDSFQSANSSPVNNSSLASRSRLGVSPPQQAGAELPPVRARGECYIKKLPYDLMLAIFALLTEMEDSMAPVAPLGLVCKQWHRLSGEPFLWEHLAKKFFVAFPLVHQLTGVSATSTLPKRNMSNSSFGQYKYGYGGMSENSGNSPYLSQNHKRIGSASEGELTRLASGRGVDTSTTNERPASRGTPKVRTPVVNDKDSSAFNRIFHSISATFGEQKGGLRRRRVSGSDLTSPTQKKHKPPFTSLPAAMRPKGPRASKKAFLTRLHDVENIDSQRKYQDLVMKRRGPVLHAFMNGALFCLCMSVLVAMLALEGVEPTSAFNAEVAFGFFWCTYLFIFATVITNVVMAAHFEPHPLVPRLRRHLTLIIASTFTLFLSLLVIVYPVVVVQRNVFKLVAVAQKDLGATPPERSDWLQAVAPIILAFLMWQGQVVYSVKETLKEWYFSGEWRELSHWLQFSTLYHISAHCTPTFFAASALCGVEATLNPTSTFHLVAGCFPLLMTLAILSLVFLMEFSTQRKPMDGFAALSLFIACFLPISIMLLPLRGFTLLPLQMAITGFYLGHLNEMRRRMVVFEYGLDSDELSGDPSGVFEED